MRYELIEGTTTWLGVVDRILAGREHVALVIEGPAYFLRPVQARDIEVGGVPVAYLTEDREYLAEGPTDLSLHLERQWLARSFFGLTGAYPLLGNRGPQVVATEELVRIERYMARVHNWSWFQIFESGVSLNDLYAAWLAVNEYANVVVREPVFRMCMTSGERRSLEIRGTTTEDLSRSYLGYVGPLITQKPSNTILGQLPLRQLLKALLHKVVLPFPRLKALITSVKSGK